MNEIEINWNVHYIDLIGLLVMFHPKVQ